MPYYTVSYVLVYIAVGVLVGAFSFATDGAPSQLLRLIEIGTNLRSRFFQLPYGDQALFVFRGVFQRLGRFPQIPFMEDFDFVIHARQLGKVAVSPLKVHSSARRWRQQGTISNTLRNQVPTLMHNVAFVTVALHVVYYLGAFDRNGH